jgi:hypothetical protein
MFTVTVTTLVSASSAESARQRVEGTIREGVRAGYIGSDTVVTSVDAYVAPRTYTQEEFDAAVLAAAANARTQALAEAQR